MVGEQYRLRADACLTTRDGALVIQQNRFEMALDGLDAGRRAFVRHLAEGWMSVLDMRRLITAGDGADRVPYAHVLLRHLVAHSWLRRRIRTDDRPLLDLLPRALGAASLPPPPQHEPEVGYRLSRFATARVEVDQLVVQTPLSTIASGLADGRLATVLAAAAGDPGCDRATGARVVSVDEASARRL